MNCKCGRKINRSKFGIMFKYCSRCREQMEMKLREKNNIQPKRVA
jgi:exosome complex RNA-binding protein Csl4